MDKANLVLIPGPGISHLVSIFEFGKRLLDRDDRFLITVLIMKSSGLSEVASFAQSLFSSDTRIQYITLPDVGPPPSVDPVESVENFFAVYVSLYKSHVKDTILNQILSKDDSVPLAGLILDIFCSSMIDVGKELAVPSYIFFPSGAAFLGLMLYMPVRHDQIAGVEFEESDVEYDIPCFVNPVPSRVLPGFMFNKLGYTSFLNHARNFMATKGIIVNSFLDLESHAINSFKDDNDVPPVYNIGPLLDLKGNLGKKATSKRAEREEIISWLDAQEPESVVFLCFGSVGSFSEPQLQEIAIALEKSGHKFLWSARKSPPKDKLEFPSEFTKYEEFLPEGFLERTKHSGLVRGWVPQLEVLGHKAIGAFVSHCGWNSVLESFWYGVPLVTWPIFAEQQINAFQLVKDLGLAVELKLDFRNNKSDIVSADEIERSVKLVMNRDCEVRFKVKEISVKGRQAVMEGGSSYDQFGNLIEDISANKA